MSRATNNTELITEAIRALKLPRDIELRLTKNLIEDLDTLSRSSIVSKINHTPPRKAIRQKLNAIQQILIIQKAFGGIPQTNDERDLESDEQDPLSADEVRSIREEIKQLRREAKIKASRNPRISFAIQLVSAQIRKAHKDVGRRAVFGSKLSPAPAGAVILAALAFLQISPGWARIRDLIPRQS
jgi:hypothetical protein